VLQGVAATARHHPKCNAAAQQQARNGGREAATRIVLRRRAAATRGDNVFLAWSRVASRTFKLEATLLRRVWMDCPTRSGGSFQLYCDARAASEPSARACRRVVEVAETAGA